ncbi:MAG TPA: hypothetical protein VKA84_21570 [Gemmatimonadaceae bacterium]|nr:hypothetical protein [Gemmatimonadaceae bacterium]
MRHPGSLAPLAAALLLLLPVAACSKDAPTGPTRGALSLGLTTPNADDGAVLLAIDGGPVDSVTAVGAYRVYGGAAGAPAGTPLRVIVRGTLAAGPVARVWVPDVSAVGAYRVTVEQAAARTTYGQRSVSGYAGTVTR